MAAIIDLAMQYADMGWHIVPLYGIDKPGTCSCSKKQDCPSAGKHPRINDWMNEATCDEEKLIDWYEKWPDMNIGLLLGPKSLVIDVEYDDEEGKATANQLFGETATPTYKSGRSIHRIFKFTSDLPKTQKKYIHGLEVRIGGGDAATQSVLPPSQHVSGIYYEWLPGLSPGECDVCEIPEQLMTWLWNRSGIDGRQMDLPEAKGHGRDIYEKEIVKETEDGRNNTLHAAACRLSRQMHNLNAPETQREVYQLVWGLNLAKCYPPLEQNEVQRLTQSAIEFILSSPAMMEDEDQQTYANHGLQYEHGKWSPGQWKLITVMSDPITYKLVVPAWKNLTYDGRGEIWFEVADYRKHDAVARIVQEATGRIVLDERPRLWPTIWNGVPGANGFPGVKAQLMNASEVEHPSPTDKRYVMIADYLLSKLSAAGKPEEQDVPDLSGRPKIRKDGTYWFNWNLLWQDALMMAMVTSQDITNLKRRLKIDTNCHKQYTTEDGKTKIYCVFDAAKMRQLELMATDRAKFKQAKDEE